MNEIIFNQSICQDRAQNVDIAVLIPCYNEEITITKVIEDFREVLPNAKIYVYDNNSVDRTAEFARAAGALVFREKCQGKGHVVRRMFADIDADIYVLVDGDDTYDAGSATMMINHLIDEQVDMVVGARKPNSSSAYRRGHQFGNVLLTRSVAMIFRGGFRDMLSGYRVFSRNFVKSFPSLSKGFEIETELTVHALELNIPFIEIETPYNERPIGSASKLRTFYDGYHILKTIFILVKEERPLLFFSTIFLLLSSISVILAIPIFIEYIKTGLVPRFPTAILSTGLMILAFLSLVCGLILDTVTRGRYEMKRLCYLSISKSSIASSKNVDESNI